MNPILLVHIVAGSLGLVTGFVTLYAAKGAPIHRKVGMAFVAAMLTMTPTGLVVAITSGVWAEVNIPAAIVTGYLVVTGLTTVRPPARGARALSVGAMLVALAVGLTTLTFGVQAIAQGGNRNGIPAFPFFMFGTIGTLAAIGDLRLLRAGALRGTARIARHLWRMSLALFIAAMSFFIGQADEFPKTMRIMPLLALPPLAVLATLLYWVWRVRFRRSARGLTVSRPAADAPATSATAGA
jgi:uncharacterized membrane protein